MHGAKNRGLVYRVAWRYAEACKLDRASDMADLALAGYIGLMEAARTYDKSKGVWSSWAGRS